MILPLLLKGFYLTIEAPCFYELLMCCINKIELNSNFFIHPSSVIVVLSNKEDTMALLLEAESQGLMNGDYIFLLVQHFEVSGTVVSKTFTTQ